MWRSHIECAKQRAVSFSRFVAIQICVDMSSTILEKTRFLQEDIERYEKAIEAELNTQPKTVRTPLIL